MTPDQWVLKGIQGLLDPVDLKVHRENVELQVPLLLGQVVFQGYRDLLDTRAMPAYRVTVVKLVRECDRGISRLNYLM